MRLLFLAKRWHLWRHRFAKWLLVRAVNPLALRLGTIVRESGTEANALHDKARMRYEVCLRCPLRNPDTDRCSGQTCGCPMRRLVQLDTATCPQKRW